MFLDNFPQINSEDVFAIEWHDDPISYDEQLYKLGEGLDYFVIFNPRADCKDLYYVNDIPDTEKCIVWHNGDTWLAKFFFKGWRPYKGYKEIRIEPTEMVWSWNPDIDKLMQFEEDIYGKFEPLPWDRKFKMVWYIDKRFNPLDDEVWAFSCQPKGSHDPIRKEMGYVIPKVDIEYNKLLPKLYIDINECYPPFWELVNECAIELDQDFIVEERMWVLKITPSYRKPRDWRWIAIVTPEYRIEYNKDIPICDYDINLRHSYHDLKYTHTLFLDRNHLTNNEPDIWVCKICYTDETEGDKHAGFVSPTFRILKNPDFKFLNYDIEYTVPYTDLAYDHMWMLDESLTKTSPEPIYAFKARAAKKSKGVKIIGEVKPVIDIEFNKDLEGYDFELPNWNVEYHDFKYLHVWHLRSDLIEQEKVWAFAQSFIDSPVGIKEHGQVIPKQILKINPALKHINLEINFVIPFHDRIYEHVWFVMNNKKKIWYAKLSTQKETQGTKEMGFLDLPLSSKFDVFFLSFGEMNADENFKRLKSVAPRARRIKNVKGIFNAHKKAAELSTTDMFYVVDADAEILDDFKFNYVPTLYDRKYTHVWKTSNPFNDLMYGYGGVKLFPKFIFTNRTRWGDLDLFQSVSKGVKIVDKVSNITKFNTDEYSTWRSAFREGIKLLASKETEKLKNWVTKKAEFYDYAKLGLKDAKKFYKNNVDNLNKVNDREWLLEFFNKRHRST